MAHRDAVVVRTRDEIGVGNLMWAWDFPHSDSTWPHSREAIARDFAGVFAGDIDKIVRMKCAQLYDLG